MTLSLYSHFCWYFFFQNVLLWFIETKITTSFPYFTFLHGVCHYHCSCIGLFSAFPTGIRAPWEQGLCQFCSLLCHLCLDFQSGIFKCILDITFHVLIHICIKYASIRISVFSLQINSWSDGLPTSVSLLLWWQTIFPLPYYSDSRLGPALGAPPHLQSPRTLFLSVVFLASLSPKYWWDPGNPLSVPSIVLVAGTDERTQEILSVDSEEKS